MFQVQLSFVVNLSNVFLIIIIIIIITSGHLIGVRRSLLLHLITLNDTHTHTHPVGLLWTTDRLTRTRLPDRTNHIVKSYAMSTDK